MTNGGASTVLQPGGGGPRPAPMVPAQSESVQQKKDLVGWWAKFKRSDKKGVETQESVPHGIFGIPLKDSIRYANVAISLFNEDGQSYIYGYVPIVVAKCGVYLKEKATDVEGIFRLAGSEKRIKELKLAFDSPDRYGKGLDWTGYTVHDAANILRRYFNLLPEPIIPLDFYANFREPLKNHQVQAVGIHEAQSPDVGNFDQDEAIRAYQSLITELPPLNRQLLLYILDLLAVFASKSENNKMTTPNLAAIFQPGILSHPKDDMAPQEYRLSQDVLIFLIENQDHFLIGMSGTEADPDTVRDVQSGTPTKAPGTPTTPTRSKTVLDRSVSNASVGAESVRKYGKVKRNMSVSSKHSKRSGSGPTPVPGSPGVTTPIATPKSGGVYRSNTAPSRRNMSAAHSPRFARGRDKAEEPLMPSPHFTESAAGLAAPRSGPLESPLATTSPPLFPVPNPEITSASSSEVTTPLATLSDSALAAHAPGFQTPRKDTTPLLAPPGGSAEQRRDERAASNTPSTTGSSRGFLDVFKPSPTSESESRQRKKLQKKRLPGTSLSSASTQSLTNESADDMSFRSPSTAGAALIAVPPRPATPNASHGRGRGRTFDQEDEAFTTARSTPVQPTPQRMPTDATVRPAHSPTPSWHSQTDVSDADLVGDDQADAYPRDRSGNGQEKKKRHWRFSSRSQNKLEPPATPQNPLGTMTARSLAASRSTIGSTSGGRPSIQQDRTIASAIPPTLADSSTLTPLPIKPLQNSGSDPIFSDSEREGGKKGPFGWIKNKMQERKDREAEKRSKTPDRNRERGASRVAEPVPMPVKQESRGESRAPGEGLPARGKSMEQQRVMAPAGAMDSAAGAPEQQRFIAPAGGMESGAGPSLNGEAEGNARDLVLEGERRM